MVRYSSNIIMPIIPAPVIIPKLRSERLDRVIWIAKIANSPKNSVSLTLNSDVRLNGRKVNAWDIVTLDNPNQEYLLTIGADRAYVLQLTVKHETLMRGDNMERREYVPHATTEKNPSPREVANTEAFIRQVMEQEPDKVLEFRAGKLNLVGFFVGQVMRVSQGKISQNHVNSMLQKMLTEDHVSLSNQYLNLLDEG